MKGCNGEELPPDGYTIFGNFTHNDVNSFNTYPTLNQLQPPSSDHYPEDFMLGSIPVFNSHMQPPIVFHLDYPSTGETDEGTGSLNSVEKDNSSSKPQEGSNLSPDFSSKIAENGEEIKGVNYSFEVLNYLDEQIQDLLNLEDHHVDKNNNKRYEDYRSDTREEEFVINGQRRRMFKRGLKCRRDIDWLTEPFFDIYESLLPSLWEQQDRKALLASLDIIVREEWPESRLKLYGSCANSFAFSKSVMDVSLEIEDPFINKSEVLLKLAKILSHKFEKFQIQALTQARVPIVKLFDPFTKISCDICINNSLAIVNTKLLRVYAEIDTRLQQLVFIVKHWAKSRKLNETSQGTLSSYAYVLMCIHFLQTRKPSILPCLQQMTATYEVSVGSIICAYYDDLEELFQFGSENKETIGRLVWEFFKYWAYCHDYTSEVISVRTGRTLSKRSKNWNKSTGNDRHLICIEDPFDELHDLGRVVDYRTIHALREEFERAAEIIQFNADPCVKLFEPYIPGC